MGAITSKSVHFFVIIAFRKIVFKKQFFEHVSNYHWSVYIIQSIITTLALVSIIMLSLNTERIPMIAVISSVGLLFLNIVVFGLLESSARLGNNIRENALLKQQVEIELDNVKSLSQAFDAQRQSIHDYKHNLGIIYQLLDMHQYQQALNYIQSLSEDFYHTLYRIKTDHSIIDAILNLKDIQAKMTGIILDIKAGDLSGILIPDDLLVTVIDRKSVV